MHRAPSTSVGRVGAHDAAGILSHCAWVEPFGPVSELMAGGGCARPVLFVENGTDGDANACRGQYPPRSVTLASKCWTGERADGGGRGWRRELSVQSLGRARGGRCSVPRPKVRRRGTPSACARCVVRGPRESSVARAFFLSLFANEFQPPSLGTPPSGPCLTIAASRRHSIHDFSGFHLPFPEYKDGVAMEMSLAATCLANRLGGAAGMADFLLMVVPCPSLGVGWLHFPREPCRIARLPAVGGTSCPEIWE